MPASQNRPRCGGNGNNNGKKKKKGRAPAHQNAFAYRHNPKSKLTERILSSPNVGTCRRCHDKIEWRKRYRKYRPRTQPGTCNVCRRRNVMAAYHTVCGDCCWITTTVTMTDRGEGTEVGEVNSSHDASGSAQSASGSVGAVPVDRSAGDGDGDDSGGCDGSGEGSAPPASDPSHLTTAVATGTKRVRMCAVCTKEPVLSSSSGGDDANDDGNVDVDATSLQGLKLRERRTIERNALREKEERRRRRRGSEEGGDAEEGDGEEDGGEEDEERDLTSEEDGLA